MNRKHNKPVEMYRCYQSNAYIVRTRTSSICFLKQEEAVRFFETLIKNYPDKRYS